MSTYPTVQAADAAQDVPPEPPPPDPPPPPQSSATPPDLPQPGPSSYNCQHCNSKFRNISERDEHSRKAHKNVLQHKCPYCNFSSVNLNSYVLHVNQQHPQNVQKHVVTCMRSGGAMTKIPVTF